MPSATPTTPVVGLLESRDLPEATPVIDLHLQILGQLHTHPQAKTVTNQEI